MDGGAVVGGCLGGSFEEGGEPVAEEGAEGGEAGADYGDADFDYGPDGRGYVVPFGEVSGVWGYGFEGLQVVSLELSNETMNFSRTILVTQALENES